MPAKHKYGAVKTVVDGIKFDSKAEAARYEVLKILLKAGVISDLQLQPTWILADPVRYSDARRNKPALRYVADFSYIEVGTGRRCVEDVKGITTEAFEIKRHLMLALKGVEITIIRTRA